MSTTPKGAEPAPFSIPEALLARLRERRAIDRTRRGPPRDADPGRTYLSTVAVVRDTHSAEDVPRRARAFAEDLNDLQTQVEEAYDAFLLHPGMGPMLYLTADGRVIADNRTWDGSGIDMEVSLDEAIMSVVVGSDSSGIDELLELIPPLRDGAACPKCNGTRWVQVANVNVVCFVCYGRGEADERLIERAKAVGLLPKTPA